MLITRCPNCGTSFRIRPEQLNLRGGRVRCGKCQNAFSALDSLDELPDTESEAAAAAAPRAVSPGPATQTIVAAPTQPFMPVQESRPTVAEPAVSTPTSPAVHYSLPPATEVAAKADNFKIDFDLGFSHDNRIEPTMPEAWLAEGIETPATSSTNLPFSQYEPNSASAYSDEEAVATLIAGLQADPNSDAAMKALEASITEAIEVRGIDAEFDIDEALDIDVNLEDEPEKAPVIVGNAASRMLSSKPVSTPLPVLPTFAVEEEGEEAESAFDHGLPTEPLPENDIDEPLTFADDLMDPGTVFLDDEITPPVQPSRTRAKPNWWALGVLGLLLAAAAQCIFTFRMELARAFPATRSALEQVCATLGCKVPYPKDADQILVEGTDLTPDPSGTGHYRLIVTLRNKANYPQSWPQLELTLTDRFDRALSRRVLAPNEWLPASLITRPAFDAQGEVTANVAISTDLPAAGYRVYTFYP